MSETIRNENGGSTFVRVMQDGYVELHRVDTRSGMSSVTTFSPKDWQTIVDTVGVAPFPLTEAETAELDASYGA